MCEIDSRSTQQHRIRKDVGCVPLRDQYIHKQHAVVIFIPIESKDTPYNQTGWCTFSCLYPVDVFRAHLAFSEDSDEEYAVYLQKVTKHYEDVKLFLYCNVLTSYEALQSLIYTTALCLGNYRELESDCLEFAKAVAKQAKRFFATEVEMGKAIVNLRMDNPQALDNLTVTILASKVRQCHEPKPLPGIQRFHSFF